MNIITQNHIAEFIALLLSLIFFQTLKKGRLKSLPFFLLFILLVELSGSYLRRILHLPNTWLYNLSIPVEYSYYLFLFWLYGQKLLKRTAVVGFAVLAIVTAFYFFYLPIKAFHSNVLLTGQALVIVSTCIYIYEIFQSADDQPLYKNAFFWLVSGLFLFNLGEISYFVLYPSIHKNGWDSFDNLFQLINNNLLLVLYLSYIAAILICKKYEVTANAGNH
jgi:hypothetical protein